MDGGSIDSDSMASFIKKLELSNEEVKRCSICPTMIAWVKNCVITYNIRWS